MEIREKYVFFFWVKCIKRRIEKEGREIENNIYMFLLRRIEFSFFVLFLVCLC